MSWEDTVPPEGQEALREWQQRKQQKEKEQEQAECPHDEDDHGICLDCGKDILDDLIGRAELLKDE